MKLCLSHKTLIDYHALDLIFKVNVYKTSYRVRPLKYNNYNSKNILAFATAACLSLIGHYGNTITQVRIFPFYGMGL